MTLQHQFGGVEELDAVATWLGAASIWRYGRFDRVTLARGRP
jgi:hypothetical protein